MRRLCSSALLALWLLVPASLGAEEPDRFFDLYDLAGKLYSLKRVAAAEGVKVVVVDFFWDGCEPCKKALPEWVALHEKYRNKGLALVVVGIRAGDEMPVARDKLKRYFVDHPVPFPVVFDKFNVVARQYEVVSEDDTVSLPQLFLLSPEGKLLFRSERCTEAKEKVEELLSRP